MRIVELNLRRSEAVQTMSAMRLWLDEHAIEPSHFTSTEVNGELVMRTVFQARAEAEAFAERFAGSVLAG